MRKPPVLLPIRRSVSFPGAAFYHLPFSDTIPFTRKNVNLFLRQLHEENVWVSPKKFHKSRDKAEDILFGLPYFKE
jgi:hypothetical protein